jgi:hypothetical protein
MSSTPNIFLLIVGVALATASCASSPSTTPASPADTNLRTDATTPLYVEDAVVLIAQSFPAQVSIQIKGSLPDPCSAVGTVTQRREGNKIIVTVPVRRGTMPCAQVIQPTTVSVRLEGVFEPGSYTVIVNGVAREFKI